MKKSRNCTWLILGIITIILGIVIPFVFMNSDVYYESSKNTVPGSVTFNIKIFSKDEIKDIENVVVHFDSIDDEEMKKDVYYIKPSKDGKLYVYELQVVIDRDWQKVQEIDEIEVVTSNSVFEVNEKIGLSSKIPVVIFACVIGAFMIFVNFLNNNSKNRAIELKEIIASTIQNDYENYPQEIEDFGNTYNSEETSHDAVAEKSTIEQTKECEYCGTLADINDKVCSSCGAKFKKK